jgi:diguanylate cyclase
VESLMIGSTVGILTTTLVCSFICHQAYRGLSKHIMELSKNLRRHLKFESTSLEGMLLYVDGVLMDINFVATSIFSYSISKLKGEHIVDLIAPGYMEVLSTHLHPGAIFPQIEGDLSGRRDVAERVIHAAYHDNLTQLGNRTLFLERLIKTLEEGARETTGVVVMCVDLDRFKSVNDTLGHAIGDKLLVEVAGRLKSSVRSIDTLARLGGDEFALIMPRSDNPRNISEVAARIVSVLSQPFEIEEHHIEIGASVGIALFPNDTGGMNSHDKIIRAADMALYKVKGQGGGGFRFFEAEMEHKQQERHTLTSDLREAIASNKIDVYYQPVVSCRYGQIQGFEALARWRHGTRGYVPPLKFIPLAEESGLIGRLGMLIMKAACTEAVSWMCDVPVAVNLSLVQFRGQNLPDCISSILDDTGLIPSRLELEITEAFLIEDEKRAMRMLYKLKDLGVKIALDDFGIGYAGPTYISRFPFDKIKIDKSFVHGAHNNRRILIILQSMIDLCSDLGLTVVAEGVETEEQEELLRSMGCHQMQGYLSGRPLNKMVARCMLEDASKLPQSMTVENIEKDWILN